MLTSRERCAAYIDEFLLSLVFRTTSLILEHHVVVPSRPCTLAEKNDCSLPQTYLRLTLKSFVGFNKGLPDAMSCCRSSASRAALSRSCGRPHQLPTSTLRLHTKTYFALPLLCSFFLDLLEFPHQLGSFIFLVTKLDQHQTSVLAMSSAIPIIIAAITCSTIRVRVDLPGLFQYPPPLGLGVFLAFPAVLRVTILELSLGGDYALRRRIGI